MAICIELKKRMPDFTLDISYESLEKRIGILGAARSGKSTLLKCIAGIEKPEHGKIQLHGRTVCDADKHIYLKAGKREVGFLTSDYALFPNMSVEDNILCGYRGKRDQREQKMLEYLRRYELAGLEDLRPDRLTDRAQLRTAMARMLIGEPQVVLFDEPFFGRAGYEKEDLLADFSRYLKEYEGGYFLASKNPSDIYQLCDVVLVLERGKVIAAGPVKQIYENPESLEVARITGCRNFSRIEMLDEHRVLALDWGVALRTEKSVQPDMTHVGIRDYHIQKADGSSQNSFLVQVLEQRKGMHSAEYEVRNAADEHAETLFWKTEAEETAPTGLYVPPEKLMLLK